MVGRNAGIFLSGTLEADVAAQLAPMRDRDLMRIDPHFPGLIAAIVGPAGAGEKGDVGGEGRGGVPTAILHLHQAHARCRPAVCGDRVLP